MDAADGEAQKEEPQGDTGVDGEEGKQEAVEDGEWEIPYSDEELEDPKNWMPPPAEIKRLYEILAKGEMLELDFVPLPRRSLTPERKPSPERDDEDDAAKEREREERERKSVLLLFNISLPQDFVGIVDDKPLYFFLQATISNWVWLWWRANASHSQKLLHRQTQNTGYEGKWEGFARLSTVYYH